VINFKKVMAFVSKNTLVGQTPAQQEQTEFVPQPQPNPQPTPQPQPNNELELSELEFLLRVLKNADLKGHQVEMFYNMIVKLQNLYLKKSGKQ
jgi:hypothetical protein